MRYYLVGYMYSGKTTLGKQLAHQLDCPFIDLDQRIEERYHTTIPFFFQHYGEAAFRIIERHILEETAQYDSAVISTGGGTPCYGDNMQYINAHGCSVFLHMTPAAICSRADKSHKQRPLLADKTPEERLQYVEQQLAQRLPYYQQAHITIDGLDADAKKLAEQLQQL